MGLAVETVKALLEDAPNLNGDNKTGRAGIYSLLDERKVRHINYQQWKQIDLVEVERGAQKEKPREKITSVDEMISIIS